MSGHELQKVACISLKEQFRHIKGTHVDFKNDCILQ